MIRAAIVGGTLYLLKEYERIASKPPDERSDDEAER